MPAKAPVNTPEIAEKAALIGRQIRGRRKELGVSAASAAESAGMSRVTWHRIERGEVSVTFGAYLSALEVLNMPLSLSSIPGDIADFPLDESLPLRIHLSQYPQLKRLAWQVQGVETLTPREALGFYERNWRHLDIDNLDANERQLIEALREVFKGSAGGV